MALVCGMLSVSHLGRYRALHIVHPSFWIKTALTFMTPFVSKKFWKKVEYIKYVRDLYLHIEPNQVVLPAATMEYDLTQR